MIALHQRSNDYARFLPAVNGNFSRFTRRSATSLRRPMPAGLAPSQLDFLNPSGLFHYPWALYTAAEGVNDKTPTMISDRDRSHSFVLGDSGGFSLISGAVKEAMSDFRERSLRWIEKNCDVGLPVDIPTRAIDVQPNVWNIDRCLHTTLDNTDFSASNAATHVRLLAVYQGRNHKEARRWIEGMKTRRLWGLAIGGHTRLDFWFWVSEIKKYIDAGYFDHIRHIHVLGNTEPGVAVMLTALKRALRGYLKCEDFEITFDSSRAYRVAQAYGQVTTGLKLGIRGNSGAPDAFDFRSFKFPQFGAQVDRSSYFPFASPIGNLCTVGDLMPGASPADPAFDEIGSNLLSHHETYMELAAIEQATLLCDMDQKTGSLVPWHVQEGVRAIHNYFKSGDIIHLNDRKHYLQHYNNNDIDDRDLNH